eukprot:363079-Chlamydomonas_euryale.AAC.8
MHADVLREDTHAVQLSVSVLPKLSEIMSLFQTCTSNRQQREKTHRLDVWQGRQQASNRAAAKVCQKESVADGPSSPPAPTANTPADKMQVARWHELTAGFWHSAGPHAHLLSL